MQKNVTKKMALTAMLACLAFVLNTFVSLRQLILHPSKHSRFL